MSCRQAEVSSYFFGSNRLYLMHTSWLIILYFYSFPYSPIHFCVSSPHTCTFSGDFVIGLNEIDESWWCGEIHGMKGIFPRNFVWPINKDIMQVEEMCWFVGCSEKELIVQEEGGQGFRIDLKDWIYCI